MIYIWEQNNFAQLTLKLNRKPVNLSLTLKGEKSHTYLDRERERQRQRDRIFLNSFLRVGCRPDTPFVP